MIDMESVRSELSAFWDHDDGRTAAERAADYGIDLSLIQENLRLPVIERLRRNDALLNEAQSLREAYRTSRE